MAQEKTKTKGSYSTFEQKEQAINFVRLCCERRLRVTNHILYKKFGVNSVVSRLEAEGFIQSNGQQYVFKWLDNSGQFSAADIVSVMWKRHAHKEKETVAKTEQTRFFKPTTATQVSIFPPSPQFGIVERVLAAKKICDLYGVQQEEKFISDFIQSKIKIELQ